MAVRFTRAEAHHIPELIEGMRLLDRDEMQAASGPDFKLVLERSVAMSYAPGAALWDGGLMCLFGVVPVELMSNEAAIWLIGTDLLTKHPRALNQGARSYICEVRRAFPRLFNYVDARNLPSIRWLRYIGFEIEEAVPYGCEGRPFHRFSMGY